MLALQAFFQCLLLQTAIASAIQPVLREEILAAKPIGLVATPSQTLSSSISSSAVGLPPSSAASPTHFASPKDLQSKHIARSNEYAPSPTQPGLTSACNAYYLVQHGDYCATVIEKFGNFTLAEFYSWNPAVKSDCSQLLAGYYVCIGVSYTSAAGIAARSIDLAPAAPIPTQSGIASNCNNYYEAASGDTCVSIANGYGITLSQFLSWNPAVGTNCQNLLAGYYVCVGVQGMDVPVSHAIQEHPTNIVDTSTTPAPTTTSTSASATSTVPVPTPVQSGIASDCTEYYRARWGDTCISVVDRFSYLTLSIFENWNPAVGNDCTSLLAGYYYCVGTADVHG